MLLIRTVDLFIFSNGSNRNKQGRHVTHMWQAALSSALMWHPTLCKQLGESVLK